MTTSTDLYTLKCAAQDAKRLYQTRKGQAGAKRSIESARWAWVKAQGAYAAAAAKFFEGARD